MSALKGEWENGISGKQMDSVQEDSCTFSHGNSRGNKHNRPLLLQGHRLRLTEEDLRQEKSQGERVLLERKVEKHTSSCKGNCTNPLCNFWHPPVRQNYKSETGCNIGDKCLVRHTEADRHHSKKKSKKSGGKIGRLTEGAKNIWVVCPKRLSHWRSLFYRRAGKWDQIAPSNSPRARDHIKNRERKGPSQGVLQKCEPQERSSCAAKFEDDTLQETLQQERCAENFISRAVEN